MNGKDLRYFIVPIGLVVLFSCGSSASSSEEAKALWEYEYRSGTAQPELSITGYNGSRTSVTVPGYLDVDGEDLPVTHADIGAITENSPHIKELYLGMDEGNPALMGFDVSFSSEDGVSMLEKLVFGPRMDGSQIYTLGRAFRGYEESYRNVWYPDRESQQRDYFPNLKELVFSEGIEEISFPSYSSYDPFNGQSRYTDVRLLPGLIGGNIETIALPSTLEKINGEPFIGVGRGRFEVDEENPVYEVGEDGGLYRKEDGAILAAPTAMESEELALSGAAPTGSYAFSDIGSLRIGDGAEIETRAFACSDIDEITIEGDAFIDHMAFLNSSVRKIAVEADFTGQANSFMGCYNLEEVALKAEDTETDYAFAFYLCQSLSDVSVEGVRRLYLGAFGLSPIEDLTLSEGLEAIGAFAFGGIKADSIVIPSTVTAIGSGAFAPVESFVPYSGEYLHFEMPEEPQRIFTYCETKEDLVDLLYPALLGYVGTESWLDFAKWPEDSITGYGIPAITYAYKASDWQYVDGEPVATGDPVVFDNSCYWEYPPRIKYENGVYPQSPIDGYIPGGEDLPTIDGVPTEPFFGDNNIYPYGPNGPTSGE